MSRGGASLPSQADALLRTLWALPQPATLQDAAYRLVDVNEAFAQWVGWPREELIGRDPLELQPPQDRELNRAAREQMTAAAPAPPHGAGGRARAAPVPSVLRRRLVNRAGREHWFSIAVSDIAAPGRPPLWLSLLQDLGAEHRAQRLAQRAEDELTQWFELSGSGMLVYDDAGLVVRSNAAFESLVERVPVTLGEAAPELQQLLGWDDGARAPALVAGARPLERQVLLTLADGRRRRLWARLACETATAQDAGEGGVGAAGRVLAVVQDRSVEDERDLARLEMGMLMETASIGVATYDPARGWIAPPPGAAGNAVAPAPAAGGRGAPAGALLGIGRELVDSASLPEFERLQRALRSGERTEVRYAVRHPELGLRWLLTRVEPGALAGGRPTTSIVTLDVTEQEAALRRNEQLLRELSTILDSSAAGIAYLRGPTLVRCNRRFERLLRFAPGEAAGASLEEILARSLDRAPGAADPRASPAPAPAGRTAHAREVAREARRALQATGGFDTELTLAGAADAEPQWLSLSLKRAAGATGSGEAGVEAVAVLTDITRLKGQQAELQRLLHDRELMFNLSEVGIVYQRGARIERANQAMADLTGWASPELAMLDPAELYENARECVAFEARIAQALRENGRFVGERRLRRRDGTLGWVQVAVRPVHHDRPGDGVICSFVDVDERHHARQTLALQAERTRAILDSVLVGIVTVSTRGIEWMNRSARRMFAGELADFVGEPLSVVATPEPDHPLRRQDWLERLREGQSEIFECRLRGRDGREFWVVGNAVLTRSGGQRELTFALLDIQRRRQAEIRNAQAQASLQRVIETAPLAIALFDAESLCVQQLNRTAAAFFGGPQARPGAAPEALCGPAQAQALRRWLEEAAGAGDAVHVHEWHDEAAQHVWDCRLTPLAGGGEAAGAPVPQLLLVASDVTAQRAAERARLQAAIDQREVLVREVHHRIKNNLQGVAGLLQQNAVRHPEMAAALSEAVGQVQAIAQVYGLQVGASGPLAVAGLLRAIAQSVQRTFGRPVHVDELAPGVPHLLPEAEAIPIALTVNELITNAIKHGRPAAGGRAGARGSADGRGAAHGADADGRGGGRRVAAAPGAGVRCTLQPLADGAVALRIASTARLPPGFDLESLRGGVSGLGLVRALLPRRSAQLALRQEGTQVIAEVLLRPPSVLLPADEPATAEPPADAPARTAAQPRPALQPPAAPVAVSAPD